MKNASVTTKEELRKAYEARCDQIVIHGELARTVYAARKLRTLSVTAVAALVAAVVAAVGLSLAAAPVTGGASLFAVKLAVAPIAVTTGINVEVLILMVFIGAATIVGIARDYDMEFTAVPLTLKLTKRK